MNTCCSCEEREPGYHSITLCGRCFCEALVCDGREAEAFEAAVVEGVPAGDVQAMVRECHERRERMSRNERIRAMRPANDVTFPSDPVLDTKTANDRELAIVDMEAS